MRVNADFSRRAVNTAPAEQWIRSPETGVDRRMLDRIGDEVARATSIVRYAAGSSFQRHSHAKGEEFLVLDGVFSDEHAHYPCGTYVRNPPGSGHSPYSTDGCRILVKLRQFAAEDLLPVVIDTNDELNWRSDSVTGGEQKTLHIFETEQVSMLRIRSGQRLSVDVGIGGLEWLLVSGSLSDERSGYEAESWWRYPAGDTLEMNATSDCLIWQKTGHLPDD
jgi:hypothetical protein